jgi:hypothetical protein
MFFDFRIDERLPMPLQLSERAFLVGAHQTAVTGYISSQNCCQPALHDAPSNSRPLPLTNVSEPVLLATLPFPEGKEADIPE